MEKDTVFTQNDVWLSGSQRKGLWCLLLFIGVLRIAMMFQVPFTDTTEARYAEIARKMVETGDWITPQFQYGVPFWGKPPLHTWTSAAGMKLFGVNQFGARIFIFITGLLTLWMLYHWVREKKGRDYALVGLTILTTSALFYLSLATVMTDLVMASGVFMSMAGFYAAVEQRKYAKTWSYLFFFGLGIGMLAKGPVAVVLTALPIGMWVLFTNRWAVTWQRIPWIKGTLLTCFIFLPWYVAAELKTPGFLEYFIVGEHLNRFLESGWKGDLYGSAHAEAKGMIWVFWLAAVLPWSLFFVVPLFRIKRVTSGVLSESDGWSLYLFCWAISPMLFFTMASNIIATYVITGIPAICFLSIDLWGYALRINERPGKNLRRFFIGTAGFASILFTIAYAVFVFGGPASAKKSQKYLVERTVELREADSGDLFYWQKRYYSAEFYTAGQVKVIDSTEQLESILDNGRRDFLAMRKNKVDSIPSEILKHFQQIDFYGKDVLYYENSPTLTTSITQ
jgi:4-amino-4-deoxy-L-arabinose transferase-like glycosyltransferase